MSPRHNVEPKLPLDILLDILDFSYFNTCHVPNLAILRNLSLVSKPLGRHAQKLLFRDVFLWRDKHTLAFGAAVNPATENGRWLASQVRTFRAIVRSSVARKGRGLSQQLFIAVIRACPDLREIDLDLEPFGEFDHVSFSKVMKAHPSPVQALRVRFVDTRHYPIVSLFPHLKHLLVKDASCHLVPEGAPAPVSALHELHWRGDTSTAEWVLRGSRGSLEILTLDTPITSSSALKTILHRHGHTLRSLLIQRCEPDQISALRHCTRLEEFRCNTFPSAEVLTVLPETVEHLQFSTFIGETRLAKPAMRGLVNFVKDAPSLLNITYCRASETTEDANLLRWLVRTCQKQLILFFYFVPPFGSFPGEVSITIPRSWLSRVHNDSECPENRVRSCDRLSSPRSSLTAAAESRPPGLAACLLKEVISYTSCLEVYRTCFRRLSPLYSITCSIPRLHPFMALTNVSPQLGTTTSPPPLPQNSRP